MKTIDLLEFLKTGKFGPISLGDSYDAIVESLGPPQGKIRVTKPQIAIHYGHYEFYFIKGFLTMIQNDQFNSDYPEMMEFGNPQFAIEPRLFRADKVKNFAEIQLELKMANISFKPIEYFERVAIKTKSGVIIDFNDEYDDLLKGDLSKFQKVEEYTLIGFRYQ